MLKKPVKKNFYSDVLKFQDLISITEKKPTLKVNLVVDERTFTIYILCAIRKRKFLYLYIFNMVIGVFVLGGWRLL